MDGIYETLKNFLLNEVNERIAAESGLSPFDEKHIIFGLVDVTKYSGAKVLVSVLPEHQEMGIGNADQTVMSNDVLITIICGADTFDKVQKKVVLYAKEVEAAILAETQWPGTIESVRFESADFTFDAGNISGQLSAVEIKLTVDTVLDTDPLDEMFD